MDAGLPGEPNSGLIGSVGRRAAARARIALPASVETLNGIRTARLHNLSRTGAMVDGVGLPGVGSDIILRCGTIDALGVIVWAGNGRCGIEFDEPLDETEVARQRRIGEEAARSGVTPELRKAAEDWVNGRIR